MEKQLQDIIPSASIENGIVSFPVSEINVDQFLTADRFLAGIVTTFGMVYTREYYDQDIDHSIYMTKPGEGFPSVEVRTDEVGENIEYRIDPVTISFAKPMPTNTFTPNQY